MASGYWHRVREFWWFLRANGVDARLDLLAGERRQDWTEWMSREVRDAAYGWIDARGLFVGLEFVRDRVTKEPADDESGWMLDFCVREGLLFEKGGYYYNRFQLIPSLVIDKESIDRATDILDRAMTMAEARSGIGG